MNLIEEIKNIDKFFDSINKDDFDNMLIRNGIDDCRYMKDQDAMFYLEYKEYENIVNKLKNRKEEYNKLDTRKNLEFDLYRDLNVEAA